MQSELCISPGVAPGPWGGPSAQSPPRLPATLNISTLAARSLSSEREEARGLEASLSDRTMTSGDGVWRSLSGSLRGETRTQKGTSHEDKIAPAYKLICQSNNPQEAPPSSSGAPPPSPAPGAHVHRLVPHVLLAAAAQAAMGRHASA